MSIDVKKGRSFKYDVYSGADMQAYIKFYKRIINDSNEIAQSSTEQKYMKVGNLESIQGVSNRDLIPRYAFGNADPIALTPGKRVITGNMTFITLNKGAAKKIISEYSKAFEGKLGSENVNVANTFGFDPSSFDNNAETEDGEDNSNLINELFGSEEIMYLDQIPPFEILMNYQKDGSKKKSTRVLKDVYLFESQSVVGVNNVLVKQQYKFLASNIEPLKRDTSQI